MPYVLSDESMKAQYVINYYAISSQICQQETTSKRPMRQTRKRRIRIAVLGDKTWKFLILSPI